jgi:hypothetical protein
MGFVGTEDPKISFDLLIGSFGLSIRLRMVGGVVFLGKDSSELVMVPQTTYLHLHGWLTIS